MQDRTETRGQSHMTHSINKVLSINAKKMFTDTFTHIQSHVCIYKQLAFVFIMTSLLPCHVPHISEQGQF